MEHKDLFEKNVKQLSQVSYFLEICVGFLSDSMGKEFACNAGDAGEVCLIPGLGTASGGGYGNPLQCSCLKNPTDRGARWATVQGIAESQTCLINLAHKHIEAFKPQLSLPTITSAISTHFSFSVSFTLVLILYPLLSLVIECLFLHKIIGVILSDEYTVL